MARSLPLTEPLRNREEAGTGHDWGLVTIFSTGTPMSIDYTRNI